VRGLTARDFVFLRKGKPARILNVETLETSQDVSLNIVLVVDNSASMKQRRAIASILAAMENIYEVIRPIDNVTAIVFNDDETRTFDGKPLHVTVKETNRPEALRAFLEESFTEGLTAKTVLYEGILAGLSLIRQMPDETQKFMVVFTDGEDINSAYPQSAVRSAVEDLPNLEVYAVDYMPGGQVDPFLQSLTRASGGRTWKATTAGELGPIFEAVSSKLLYRYVVDYQFLFPPSGTFTLGFDALQIEEITTIDSSPLLNYLYFGEGQSAIPERYVRLPNQAATEAFTEEDLRGTKEKYANVLNIVGRRLRAHPDATIRLVGCNANLGDEKGNKALSRARAEGVKAYLQYIWGIDPGRMAVEARNLPQVPTSGRTPEGHEENRRVEIHSEHPAILDVIQSTYAEYHRNVETLSVAPAIESAHGIDRWTVAVRGDGQPLFTTGGSGMPDAVIELRDPALTPMQLSKYRQLSADLVVEDLEGQKLTLEAGPAPITFIRRETQRARNLGYRVQEKYALILFDFDSATIKERNASVVETIVSRIRRFPDARVEIVGHTDNIGKDDYNLKLSQRRAKAVYDQIMAALGASPQAAISQIGMGPFDPLYGNGLPENRALNRTVTVTLEYEQKD
jgi:outer membrane protein OmpA-like peptidoglycan-associated protein/Mg-chelatase subunit ChlD